MDFDGRDEVEVELEVEVQVQLEADKNSKSRGMESEGKGEGQEEADEKRIEDSQSEGSGNASAREAGRNTTMAMGVRSAAPANKVETADLTARADFTKRGTHNNCSSQLFECTGVASKRKFCM